MYISRDTMFIKVELYQELSFLSHALHNPRNFRFYTPMAHMVKRIPTYRSQGDATISSARDYLSNLHFWWYLQWPKCVTDYTIGNFIIPSHDKEGTLIFINLLEFVAIIINFIISGAKLLLSQRILPHISSASWINYLHY